MIHPRPLGGGFFVRHHTSCILAAEFRPSLLNFPLSFGNVSESYKIVIIGNPAGWVRIRPAGFPIMTVFEHKPNATRSAESFIYQRVAIEPKRGGLEFRYRVFQNLCFSDT